MLQKELAKRLRARYDTKMDGNEWLEVSSDGIPLCRIKYNGQFLSNADQNLSDEYRSKIADIQDEISTVREYVKEAFAVRSGLVSKDRLFSENESADLCRCVDFAKANCETLTYEQERQLDKLQEKLTDGYPSLEAEPPTFEQTAAPQQNM